MARAKSKTNNRQIKSKQRVAEHGEVFTAEREVNAMLNLVEPTISGIETTVLEPAVGEGEFLIAILKRRLKTISAYHLSERASEWQILKAVSSLYGVDIQADNVTICRRNMIKTVTAYLKDAGMIPSVGFIKGLKEITARNTICGNTLTAAALNGKPLVFSEWVFEPDGRIYRMEYNYQELLDNVGECIAKRRRHYYKWVVNEANENRADFEALIA